MRIHRRSSAVALMLALVLPGAACDLSPLTDPDQPVITSGSAASATGAQALRAGALGDVTLWLGGNVNVWVSVGLITDELINARIQNTVAYQELDRRSLNPNLAPVLQTWGGFGRVMYQLPAARRALSRYAPDTPQRASQLGELHALHGLALTVAAEIFCNGIPFSVVDEDGSVSYDPTAYSNAEVHGRALVQFDSALLVLPAADPLRNLARVGKGRALLALDRVAEAAALMRAGGDGIGSAAVPTAYVRNIEFAASGTSTGANGPYEWIVQRFNFGVPNGPEVTGGIDWRDPRIAPTYVRKGSDGITDIYRPAALPWANNAASSYPVASGVEARLIEAEALLRAGDAGWLTVLNQLRSAPPPPWPSSLASALPALGDPGTAALRQDLLFRERAMWLFLTGHRLGDLRRLVRQYGRQADAVFPSGAYFRGGTYGTDVTLTPSALEANSNPVWKGCTDRAP